MQPETQAFLVFLGQVKEVVLHLGLCAARLQGVFLIHPIVRRAELGMAVQIAISLGISLPVSVVLWPGLEGLAGRNAFPVGILMIKELLIGLFIGLLFSVPFWAIQASGEFIDNQRTIGDSGLSDPSTSGSSSVTASLLMFSAVALFVESNGLQIISATVYGSYEYWPIRDPWPSIGKVGLAEIGYIVWDFAVTSLVVAGPVILLLFISDFTVMALSRVAGRIDISMLLPLVKNTLFCLILLLYSQTLLHFILGAVLGAPSVDSTLRGLAKP
ncbi:MAG: type III secretion system export apparatus subunit SctT [Pseudomonadota bacterium]